VLQSRDRLADHAYFFRRARFFEPEELRRPPFFAPEPAGRFDAGVLDRADVSAVGRDLGEDGFGFTRSGKDLPFGVSASKRRAKSGSFA